MKLLLIAALLATTYVCTLLATTNLALGSLQSLQGSYAHTIQTADQWAAGNTSASFALTQ